MNMDAGTLVILTPGFPGDESDSTCLPSQQLFVGALNKIYPRLKIVVLSFEYPFRKSTYYWNGNQVISYHGWKKGWLEKTRTCFAVWNRLRKLRLENKVIGLLSFWCTECAWIGKHFARLHGLSHFAWILGQDARKENKWVSWISPRPEELIALSDFLAKEFFRNHGIRPKYIIPNAIEPDLFEAAPRERDIDLLGVGSLITLKQYEVFIAVVKALSGLMPSLRCVICGMGSELENLQSLIDHLQLGNNVSLIGERPHSEVLALMQRSRILLHPSSYEGYSTVCLEALYAGAQVISFSNPKESWIRHWHIVNDQEDMIRVTMEILSDKGTDHQSILVYSMDQQAEAIMDLYHYKEEAMA